MWTDSEPQDAQPYQFKAKRTTWYDNLEKQEQPEQYSEFVDDEQDDAPEKVSPGREGQGAVLMEV
jgi:hypothetical protein